MNICVLHGNELSSNSDRAAKIVKNAMLKYNNVKFSEYYLPKDIPYLCQGCYECSRDVSIIEEEKCHFAKSTHEVVETVKKADAIIICASVFSLSGDGHIKSFLDHFANKLTSTLQPKNTFKSALVLSITPKNGLEPSVRSIAESLAFWGAQRVHYTSVVVCDKVWDNMPEEMQSSCTEIIERKTRLFYESL